MKPLRKTVAHRALTNDRGSPGGGPPLGASATEPLEVGKLGRTRSFLPDGSLFIRAVPIARTGWLQYAPGEVPLAAPKQPGSSRVIFVDRAAEDLFNEETMRSFVGAAVTFGHPPVKVTAQNFDTLGKGFILRTYRGDGPDSDCLLADLIVKDKWTIDRCTPDQEVSAGYEADYVQTGDGQGKATNIIGNHLALVEKGRCGPRCAIGDEDTLSTTTVNEELMTQSQGGGKPRIPLAQARTQLLEALEGMDAADEGNGQNIHVHVHMGGQPALTTDGAASTAEGTPTAATQKEPPKDGKTAATTAAAEADPRIVALEEGQKELKGTLATILEAVQRGGAAAASTGAAEDLEVLSEATMTMDSAPLANSYQELLSQAEILVPGFRLPTFDAAMKRAMTVDRMCQGRRLVLGALSASADGAALIKGSNGDKDFDVLSASCPDVAIVFKAAAKVKAASNNRSMTGDAGRLPAQTQTAAAKPALTFSQINEKNREFWKQQGPRA